MARRTGNNYSGPRWAFSNGAKKTRPQTDDRSGVSASGGSRRGRDLPSDYGDREPYGDTAGYVASRKCHHPVGGHWLVIDREKGGDWIDADDRWVVCHFPSSIHFSVTTKARAISDMKEFARGNDQGLDVFEQIALQNELTA